MKDIFQVKPGSLGFSPRYGVEKDLIICQGFRGSVLSSAKLAKSLTDLVFTGLKKWIRFLFLGSESPKTSLSLMEGMRKLNRGGLS